MYGIITSIDQNHSTYRIFASITLAVQNILGQIPSPVNSVGSLFSSKIKTLFIVDEHFGPHKDIWMNDNFINYCNQNDIKIVVFNLEKIYNSWFPHNLKIQESLLKFNNLFQFVCDTEDFKLLGGKSPLMKTMFSKSFVDLFEVEKVEKNTKDILFIGSVYGNRKTLIEKLQNLGLSIFIINNNKGDFSSYLNYLNKYQFILCPIGSGRFLNPRVYESLYVGSTPIIESDDQMFSYYKDDLNSFIRLDFNTIKHDIENFSPTFKKYNYWLEDYLEPLL
jgi:hypothetical protein